MSPLLAAGYKVHNAAEATSHHSSQLTAKGRLKMRDWNYRHHQKCWGGKCGTEIIGTILLGVENARLELLVAEI